MAKKKRSRLNDDPRPETRGSRSLDDVYAVILDVKGDVLDLKEHVNDEVELLQKSMKAMDARIDGKLDNAELLTSLGFKLANNRAFRWGAGVIAATTVSTVAVREWIGPFWVNVIQKFAGFFS